jgi:hypothetical protein
MATTAEITVGGLLLMIYWFAIAVLYFVGNSILGPIYNFAASYPIHPSLQQGFWEISYIPGGFFGLLLVFGVVGTISFVFILARWQVTPYEY